MQFEKKMLFCHLSRLILRHKKTLSAGVKGFQPCYLQFKCISSFEHFRNSTTRRTYGKVLYISRQLCIESRYQSLQQSSVQNSISNETGCNAEPNSEQCGSSCTSILKKDAGHKDETLSSSCIPTSEKIIETYNLPLDGSQNVDDEFKIFQKGGLDEIDLNNPDESSVIIDNIAPVSPVSFNLAAFVDQSESLQQLIKLGVDLSKVEENPEAAKFLLHLDFERDMKHYIQFLHDAGVSADSLGGLLTKIPLIFKEDMEHLTIRVNYLESKKFSREAIARIITASPLHLLLNTKFVDQRLGFLQKTFHLTGDEVRFLITKCPKLIPFAHDRFLKKLFVLKEEMGFSNAEMKRLLLKKPKVYFIGRKSLSKRFDIVHNIMGIPHERILQFPGILLTREFILEQRHKYLSSLGRAQYDPKEPGYISLEAFATSTDGRFCREYAKTSIFEFNEFLKTL